MEDPKTATGLLIGFASNSPRWPRCDASRRTHFAAPLDSAALDAKGQSMNSSDSQSLVANHSNALLAFGIVLVGFLAGLILGRALARLIGSPAIGGLVSRLCIIVGTLASLPLAYHFAIVAG